MSQSRVTAFPSPTRDYLTAEQVAAEYPVSATTLVRRRQTGGGPAYYSISNRIFYRRADVEAWLDSHRVDPSTRTKPGHAPVGERVSPRPEPPRRRGRPTKAEAARRARAEQ